MPSPCRTDRRTARRPRGRAAAARRALAVAVTGAALACGPTGEPVRVVIPQGASFRAAADSLASAHVVGSARLFRWYAAVTRHDRGIKPGTYLLRPGTGWTTTLDALVRGEGLVHTVTIPEGWDIATITPALVGALGVPAESVAAAVRDSALLAAVGAPAGTATLEGYLFPDTYTFPEGTSARVAIGVLVHGFERAWQPPWDARGDSLGMTRHQVLTLASIVEKEARVPEERPIIAAVYENRLRLHMPMQADPTVQYAIGHHVDHVYYKDLDIDSPYNTYRHTGLPPGPIASPGTASIAAVLAPAPVPYLFFVARPDGHHEFRTTFAEHTEARAAIRRSRSSR